MSDFNLREILSTDTLSASRIIINNNFNLLKNLILKFFDIFSENERKIKNISKIEILENTPKAELNAIEVSNSISTQSNLNVGKTIMCKSQIIDGENDTISLRLNKGNLLIGNGLTIFDLNGTLRLTRDFVFNSYDGIFDATNNLNYQSNLIEVINNEQIGLISLKNTTLKFIDFSNYNPTTGMNNIKTIKILTDDVEPGKIVFLFFRVGNVFPTNGYFLIHKSTLLHFNTMNFGIKITKSHQSVGLMCIVDGGSKKWIPILLNGCEIE